MLLNLEGKLDKWVYPVDIVFFEINEMDPVPDWWNWGNWMCGYIGLGPVDRRLPQSSYAMNLYNSGLIADPVLTLSDQAQVFQDIGL